MSEPYDARKIIRVELEGSKLCTSESENSKIYFFPKQHAKKKYLALKVIRSIFFNLPHTDSSDTKKSYCLKFNS